MDVDFETVEGGAATPVYDYASKFMNENPLVGEGGLQARPCSLKAPPGFLKFDREKHTTTVLSV